MSTNDDRLSEAEQKRQRQQTRFWYWMQWGLNIASCILTALALGLNFAKQVLLAQICLGLIAIVVVASFAVAYYRFKRNQKQREAIIEALEKRIEKEHEGQLRAYFNGVKLEQGQNPANMQNSIFDQTLREIEQKTKAEEARQRAKANPFSRPPKKGDGK